MEQWGLDRKLEVGESIEVVGYLNSSDEQELRPVMFWLANGQGVWQQLTAFPQEPEPAPSSSDEVKDQSVTSDQSSTETSKDVTSGSVEANSGTSEHGTSSLVIWLVVGFCIVAALVIGGFYLRRQGNRR